MKLSESIPSAFRRLSARLIDTTILFLIEWPFWKEVYSSLWTQEKTVGIHWSLVLYFLVAHASYEILSYYFFDATPGKWWVNLKLVSIHSHSIDVSELKFSQICLRVLSGWSAFFFSWAIYSTIFFRYDRRHWIDLWSETRVISLTPNETRPATRPWLGALLFWIFLSSGFARSTQILKAVTWQSPYFIVDSQVFRL